MRWDGLFSGLHSLWESETDNAELDERREMLRAARSQTPFVRVLESRISESSIVASVRGFGQVVHVAVVGASWVEGVSCGVAEIVIAPLHSIQWVRPASVCGCAVKAGRVFEHVTIGAKLRDLERRGGIITAITTHGGVRGRLSAVWKDAIDIFAGDVTLTVLLDSIAVISVEGP